MFRQMRRKNQILSQEESIAILQNGTTGTLAVLGDDDYPYAVPINYFYEDNKIYFHGAKAGHKIDAIKKHNKVSFCVVAQDDIITEKFTTYFKSVIAFGTARIIEDDAEKRNAIEKLTVKFTPDQTEQKRSEAIEKEFPALGRVEITIEHMTGKQALELIKKYYHLFIIRLSKSTALFFIFLFYCNRFCQISWFIHITASFYCNIISQQL